MSADIAIKVENVSKMFKLPHEKNTSLKSVIINFYKTRRTFEEQEALSNVSLEIKKGEFFGVVGRNGSGKSTLLKLLAGIYTPTQGSIEINGKLTPFIELGVGFNPELTGRENVFLNGALLGFNRKEINRMYEDIVKFAELEKFMDQKLKNYSSGMQVRLAFSIAIRAKSNILLIDEVLAVGDMNFQKKCFKYFEQLKKEGRTIILISHDMNSIKKFCNRAALIDNGVIKFVGNPAEVAKLYERQNVSELRVLGDLDKPEAPEVKILNISARNSKKSTDKFSLKDEIIIDVDLSVERKVEPIQVNLSLINRDSTHLTGINTISNLGKYAPAKGTHRISCKLKAGQLPEGRYFANIGVYTYAEPARLIDILDARYGAQVPEIEVTEASSYQDGLFYVQGKWEEKA